MRMNLSVLTVSTMLCLAGMATFAVAAPKSSETSSGGFLSSIFGPSSNDTASAKQAKRAQQRHAAKKAAAKKDAAKPAQPESAAVAEADRKSVV